MEDLLGPRGRLTLSPSIDKMVKMMAEFRSEQAQGFIVRAYCECGGELLPNGNSALMSNPPQVGHSCSHCGEVEMLPEWYPKATSSTFDESAFAEKVIAIVRDAQKRRRL